mmetsp:Transcript_32694/g.90255  ORF Transcript_32694/g.90255 Transcript_32694/m.90255 type:complete len:234 (-) Transcript_32694:1341-2042(-)
MSSRYSANCPGLVPWGCSCRAALLARRTPSAATARRGTLSSAAAAKRRGWPGPGAAPVAFASRRGGALPAAPRPAAPAPATPTASRPVVASAGAAGCGSAGSAKPMRPLSKSKTVTKRSRNTPPRTQRSSISESMAPGAAPPRPGCGSSGISCKRRVCCTGQPWPGGRHCVSCLITCPSAFRTFQVLHTTPPGFTCTTSCTSCEPGGSSKGKASMTIHLPLQCCSQCSWLFLQ